MLPALFRRDAIEVTHPGIGIPLRWPRTLVNGPFLAGFDAGMHEVADLAPKDAARVTLVRFEAL